MPSDPPVVLSLDTDADSRSRLAPEGDTTLIATLRSLASGARRRARRTRARSSPRAAAAASRARAARGGSSAASGTLNGSGSTFQKTFDEAAIQAFQNANPSITVNYAGGGSGKGKTDLQTKTVDFAGTDSLVEGRRTSRSYQGGTILYFPTVAAPITVSYNVSGVDKLQLSGDDDREDLLAARSRSGTTPAIAADNPGVDAARRPTSSIVHRADGSGTTSNFTKYLDRRGADRLDARQRRHGQLAVELAGRPGQRRRRADRASRPTARSATSTTPTRTAAEPEVRVDQEHGGHVRRADARRRSGRGRAARRSTPT